MPEQVRRLELISSAGSARELPYEADRPMDLPKPPTRAGSFTQDPLLTADEVAQRLRVSKDWVWDHSSRKAPWLPVIRLGDGALRYRSSQIEEFVNERERLTTRKRGRR